jgi:glycosyltransferase involved in cell wall biosynthesis
VSTKHYFQVDNGCEWAGVTSMNAPQITTIIPTFRREKQLKQTLLSVVNQAGIGIEVIVVDDSPEASARQVVDDLKDERIQYLHNASPSGGFPSRVRNIAIPYARAPLIHFLDDDDLAPEGYYARIIPQFSKHPDIGLIFGAVQPFGDGPAEQLDDERRFFAESSRLARLCRSMGNRFAFVSAHLFHHVLLVCSAGVVRRECAAALGGFDPELRLMEDAAFYAFIIRRFGAMFIDDIAIHYRINSLQSLMHVARLAAVDQDRIVEQLKQARRRTFGRYRQQFGDVEFYLLRTLARTAFRLL